MSFRFLYFTLLLYTIFYHFHVPFFTNWTLKSLLGHNILHYYHIHNNLKAQGKVVRPFPCNLFFAYFWHIKCTNWALKKSFRSLYFTLLLYAIFYHFHVPFFTNRAFKKSLGSPCFLLLSLLWTSHK